MEISLEGLRIVWNRIVGRRVRVLEELDIRGASVRGFLGIRGEYGSPALDQSVTLTTGQDPAAQLSWGDFPARAAVDVEIVDPSNTIDPAADLRHFPIEDPNNPEQRMFEFHWVNDPGADVDLDVTVSKFI